MTHKDDQDLEFQDITAELPPSLPVPPSNHSTVLVEALGPSDAVQAIQQATDWEEVLTLLALGAHHYLPHVQIYLLKQETLVGYLDLREGGLDLTMVRRRRLALSAPSAVHQVVQSGIIFIGTPPAGDLSINFLRGPAEGPDRRLVMVPVVVSKKPFCLLVGELESRLDDVRVPMARFAIEAALVLARKVVRRRRHTNPGIRISSHRLLRARPSQDSGPRAQPTPKTETGPVDLEHLLGRLESGGQEASRAREALRATPGKVIPSLIAQFPGKLLIDSEKLSLERLPPVRSCSAVLDALASIGPTILPSLQPLLRRRDRLVRFFATYLLSALPDPASVVLLARQVADREPLVRKMALRTLRLFRETDLMRAVRRDLLQQLEISDVRKRVDVCRILGGTGDPAAVPVLIGMLEDEEPKIAAAAHGALVSLVKQDFRLDARRWTSWWKENRWRPRVEWVFDGLVHRSAEVRTSCAMELEELMGHCFGYEVHLPKKDRDRIRKRCQEWWNFQRWWAESGITEDPGVVRRPLMLPGRTTKAD